MAIALKQTPTGMFNDLALISRTENKTEIECRKKKSMGKQ